MTAMNNVLIDTSAWIDFFRNKSGPVGDIVSDLIQSDRAYLAGPIISELLHGARGKKEASQLEFIFSTIPYLEICRSDWEMTGKSLRKLRENGLTIPLTDVLISSVSIRNRMSVLTLVPYRLFSCFFRQLFSTVKTRKCSDKSTYLRAKKARLGCGDCSRIR